MQGRDEELRFTVHDSPDYNSLKMSIFNDDKKTDLIGETWIDLTEVLHPGGGQSDKWHGLNCKGRYAGEIRIELTYYDSRPKAERHRERSRKESGPEVERDTSSPLGGPRQQQSSIRRRPLPGDPTQAQNIVHESSSMPALPTPGSQNSYHENSAQNHADFRSGSYGSNEVDYMRRSASDKASSVARGLPPQPGPSIQSGTYNDLQSPGSVYSNEIAFNSTGFAPGLPHPAEHESDGFPDAYIPATDDPYALQAVELYQEHHDSPSQPYQPRHARVQALAASHASRPPPIIPLTHTHSAPIYGAPDQLNSLPHLPMAGQQDTLYRNFPSTDFSHNSHNLDGYHSPGYDSSPAPPHRAYDDANHAPPPPPPAHRNSAPAVARTFDRSTPTSSPAPSNLSTHTPRHYSAGPDTFDRTPEPQYMLHYEQQAGGSPHYGDSYSGNPPQQIEQRYRRQRSIDGMRTAHDSTRNGGYISPHPSPSMQSSVRARASMPAFDSGRSDGSSARYERGTPAYADAPQYNIQHNMQNQQYPASSPVNHPPQNRRPNLPPLTKPRAMSPVSVPMSSPSMQGPQSPHSPTSYPTSLGQTSAVPFSPDSFAVFNPRISNLSTPNAVNTHDTSQKITPMYSSQTTTTPQPANRSPHDAGIEETPIIGSDGRIKDPSDHLPLSSYAPEPERKGGAKSTVVNIRNRFGPRQAPPMPVTTRQARPSVASPPLGPSTVQIGSPQQAPQRIQHPTPLAPAQQVISNTPYGGSTGQSPQTQGYAPRGYGYDRVEVFAPPVPQKIPLDAPERQTNGYGSEMVLAQNMANLGLDSNRDIFGGNGPPNRVRKSRWGA